MQAISFRAMRRSFRTIVVCLWVFALLAATQVAKAGPFDAFFRSIRNSFVRPTAQKHRPTQSHRTNRKQNTEAPPTDASDASSGQPSPSPTPVSAPPNRNNVRVAMATAVSKHGKSDLPYGIPVPGKQGLVTSPFSPDSGYIDVRSFPPGTEVKDPYTGKSFLTP
jgi:hypothetical protein